MRIASFFVIVVAVLLTASSAKAERIDHLPGLAPADHIKIESENTGRPYHIFVRLPEDYEDTDKTYPTVYLLDGDILFPILGAYHLLLSYDEPVPDAIMVGISYGTFDRANGNFRGVDFSTPPLPEEFRQSVDSGDADGGAAKYQRFLENELIPHIEEKYRSNPERRIILGQSRGGHFVLYSAITNPDLFWGHIASNPSLQPNKDFFFQDLAWPASTETNLFFSSGSRDIERLREEALDLFKHLKNQKQRPWHLKTMTLDGETHAAGIVNVYRNATMWLFSTVPSEEVEKESVYN